MRSGAVPRIELHDVAVHSEHVAGAFVGAQAEESAGPAGFEVDDTLVVAPAPHADRDQALAPDHPDQLGERLGESVVGNVHERAHRPHRVE